MALSLPVLAVFRKTLTCKAYTGHEVFSFLSQANLQLLFLACGKHHRDISHVERENRFFLYTGAPCLPSFLPRCHIAELATLLNVLKALANKRCTRLYKTRTISQLYFFLVFYLLHSVFIVPHGPLYAFRAFQYIIRHGSGSGFFPRTPPSSRLRLAVHAPRVFYCSLNARR